MKVLVIALASALALTPIPFTFQSRDAISTPLEILRQTGTEASSPEPDAAAIEGADEVLLSGSSVVAAAKPRFLATGTITPRAGKGRGAALGSASKGYTVWGTGKTSAGYTQIKFFGKDAWVKSSRLRRVAVAHYTTTRGTKLRTEAATGRIIATVPNDYTVGTLSNIKSKKNTWVRIQYRGKTGWVAARDLKGASLSAAVGAGRKSFSDAVWASKARNNISKYCPSVPVRVSKAKGEYHAQSNPRQITLSRVGHNDPNEANIKAVALHECAHILQFGVAASGFGKLTRYAEKINPRRDGRGIEHLADCMSEKMGAKRTGTLSGGGTYVAGYGGRCNSAQNRAARALLSGKLPAGD